jgi:hypothetical protein
MAPPPPAKVARRTARVASWRIADPFDRADDGANCLRCGYAVQPARERRGLITCAGCGSPEPASAPEQDRPSRVTQTDGWPPLVRSARVEYRLPPRSAVSAVARSAKPLPQSSTPSGLTAERYETASAAAGAGSPARFDAGRKRVGTGLLQVRAQRRARRPALRLAGALDRFGVGATRMGSAAGMPSVPT